MKILLLPLICGFLFLFTGPRGFAQTAPSKQWDKTLGSSSDEFLYALQQTADGGYIVGGYSGPAVGGDKTATKNGVEEFWVVRLDANGNKIWDRSIGGPVGTAVLYALQQTSDGGFILGGYANFGISGDKTEPNRGPQNTQDYWIVKIDASGNKLWDKTFGGNANDVLYTLIQTSDKGFLLGGYSDSNVNGDRTQATRGGSDFWVVKTDSLGNKLWDKAYGGTGSETIYTLEQTSDGGYILGGTSSSGISGDKTQPQRGIGDFWIVRTDAAGNKRWDKTFGTNKAEGLRSVQQTADGGFILGGYSEADINGDKSEPNRGINVANCWILKTDSLGNKTWDKTYGGASGESLTDIYQTDDGGYVFGAQSNSGITGDRSQATQGLTDYWLVKLDLNGHKLWDKAFGGSSTDALSDFKLTTDGGYLMGGSSYSNIFADKTQVSRGGLDYWVVKVNSPCQTLTATLSSSCGGSSIDVNVQVSGIQALIAGSPSWTLAYTLNGVSQTVSGTGSTMQLAQNVAVGSVFTLTSITSSTCTKSLNQTITVGAIPAAPMVTAANNCGPGQVTLLATGAPANGTYVWYEQANGGIPVFSNASGVFTTPYLYAGKTYYVAAANASGCESPRVPVTAGITLLTVTAGPNERHCIDSNPVQLSGFSPAGGTWAGNGVTPGGMFTPTANLLGTQTLVYTYTLNNCTLVSPKQVTVVQPVPQPAINLIAPDTLISTIAGTAYEWKLNGVTLSVTSRKIKATGSGNYTVQVKNGGNCNSPFSANYSFNVSGLRESEASNLKLYPNPTTGRVILEFSGERPSEIEVLNTLGKTVLKRFTPETSQNKQLPLDLTSLANGMYLVKVKLEKRVVMVKVRLQK